MKFYFTVEENSLEEQEIKKCSEILSRLNYKNYYLGKYKNREYVNIVFEIENIDLEDKAQIEDIKKNIKNNSNVIQASSYMKFYYKIEKTYLLKEINKKVKELLTEREYIFKCYNSHSSNGIIYVGLNVLNINPLNQNELKGFMNIVEKIEGVNQVIVY
ncbi:hypothetical protein ACFIJ5_10545 [Haloimpatiens sp. FM7330]|uniref:hypothetical protein n=1 Tax=Haloimpatiens sp. FM7330 TaxID=3298610 RepID=UPI0036367D30